jgi:hypothetical protein
VASAKCEDPERDEQHHVENGQAAADPVPHSPPILLSREFVADTLAREATWVITPRG